MANSKKLNILAVDLGFGSVKVCYRDPISQELVMEKFISSVAQLTDKPEDFDEENVFQLQGNYYAISAAALKLPKSLLMPLNDYETLKVVTPIWINYLLNHYQKKLGIKFDKVIIGLSLVYRDKANDLLSYLMDTLMTEENYFVCLPQGVAAKKVLSSYGLSLDPAKATAFKYDNYLLCDFGSNTIDISLISQGMSTPANSLGLEASGVCKINYDIIDYIYKSTGVSIDLQQAKVVLDTGQYRYRGRVYDLSEKVHSFIIKYFKEVIEMFDKNQKLSDLTANVQKIICIGGGAEIMRNSLPEINKLIEARGYPVNFWVLPERDAEYFNAIAYHLIGNQLFNN